MCSPAMRAHKSEWMQDYEDEQNLAARVMHRLQADSVDDHFAILQVRARWRLCLYSGFRVQPAAWCLQHAQCLSWALNSLCLCATERHFAILQVYALW